MFVNNNISKSAHSFKLCNKIMNSWINVACTSVCPVATGSIMKIVIAVAE